MIKSTFRKSYDSKYGKIRVNGKFDTDKKLGMVVTTFPKGNVKLETTKFLKRGQLGGMATSRTKTGRKRRNKYMI